MRKRLWLKCVLVAMLVLLLSAATVGAAADTINAENAAICVTLALEPKDGAVFDEGITIPVKLSTTIKMKSASHDAVSYIAGKFGSNSLRFNNAELVLYKVKVTNATYGTEKNEYVETVLSREYYDRSSIIIFNRSFISGLAPGKYVLKLNVCHTGNIRETVATRTFYVQGKNGSNTITDNSKEPAPVVPKPDGNHGGTGKDIVNKEEKTYKYSRWSYYNTKHKTTYYSYGKYTGSSYKSGSGKWEYKTTQTPLKKTKKVDGHQQYEGYWYNETVNGKASDDFSGGGENIKNTAKPTSKPKTTPKPSADNGSNWGSWSGWSTTPVSSSSTRQVETKQEKKTTSETTYSYSRWSYYNTSYNTTYYSYAKYTGSSYKEGSGKWEYKTTSEPLSKTKKVSGHQQYKGYWYNQKVDTEETTTTVTYYRYRDKEN